MLKVKVEDFSDFSTALLLESFGLQTGLGGCASSQDQVSSSPLKEVRGKRFSIKKTFRQKEENIKHELLCQVDYLAGRVTGAFVVIV